MQPAEIRIEEKHRILAHLGQGGTSDVHLAVAQGPIGFNKLVVLKVLKKSLQNDADFTEMFLVEARLAARLNHPNIVQTYEVLDEGGVVTMVMEYLEGRPLSSIVQRSKEGELTLSLHLRIIADALAGMHYAHDLTDFDGTPLGVVHRDFTPHNVFVTFDGQVKVLDFGIAKLNVSSVETRTGMVKGKIRYMPPEQILGRAVDRRADIYAAGVMLWQAATGVALWKDQADAAIMMKVAYGDIPAPESVNPDVHPLLASICKKAMAFEPADRYESAAALEAELEEVLKDLGDHITSRDVGRMASDLFLDVRQSTKMLIEQQLSGSVSRTWPVRLPEGAGWAPEDSSARRDSRGTTGLQPVQTPPSRRRLAIAAGAALAFLGLVTLLWASRDDDSVPAAHRELGGASAAATSPAPPAVAPPRAQVAKLRIRAVPSDARLSLDGELLPSNPYERALPLDGARHEVRADAKGYVARSERVVLERDTNLELTLEHAKASARARPVAPAPRQPPPGASPQGKPASTTAQAKAPSPAAEGPNCDKPFFIDERGIKRMLPECL